VSATVLLACALVFVFLLKGSEGVDRVAKIVVAHVFIGLWMLYILMSHRWSELSHAVPPAAAPGRLWNYVTGVEIGISSLLSWWPYIGSMVRMAPNGRTAALPIMLGMGAPVPLLGLIGIAGFLVLKTSDPAQWLRTVGGPAYGILALLFVTAANLGTTVAGTYASAIGLRYYPGARPGSVAGTVRPDIGTGGAGWIVDPRPVLRAFQHVHRLHRHHDGAPLRHPDHRLLRVATP
jgi:NCS1 family nucleobase:cation symporter-1